MATTDSLTISLGSDPNIVIQKNPLKKMSSKSFTGANRVVHLGYTIEIKNNKQNALKLRLEDRIPITQNKEIRVDEIKTNDAVYDAKTGIMKWNITVAAHEKTKKQFSYRVKFPRGKRINL